MNGLAGSDIRSGRVTFASTEGARAAHLEFLFSDVKIKYVSVFIISSLNIQKNYTIKQTVFMLVDRCTTKSAQLVIFVT